MASRELKDLVPELETKAKQFLEECKRKGINVIITRTACNIKEQIALYAQGRQSLKETNELRRIAGLPPITEWENKRKVTWTLKSKHLVNYDDADKTNDKAKAFDFVIVKDNKAVWDIKVDINKNQIPDYLEAGRIGESLGLKWGGRWKKPDYPHFEI